MNISDEQLMSYADGECSAELRTDIEQALLRDPQLASRLQQHQALRQKLSAAYDSVLAEPVPDRLLAALQAQPQMDATVVPFMPRSSGRPLAQWPQWTAMAASLLVGVFIGLFAFNQRQAPLFTAQGNQLIARGALAAALQNQLASAQDNAAIRMNVSFRNKQGDYCRTFIAAAPAVAGMACHTQDTWQIRALSSEPTATGASEYRQAASALPASILAVMDQEMSGDSLDATEERRARDAKWH